MGTPYVGECRMVGFNFAPVGWATCQGQVIQISENDTLFNLIGTTYGGDGQTTFQLPNLQGSVPIHQGNGPGSSFVVGQVGGVEEVTLLVAQLPAHSHVLFGSSSSGNTNLLQNAVLSGSPSQIYNAQSPSPTAIMNPLAITKAGGSQPHSNLQPYLAITWIISLNGIYPTPT